MIMKESNTQERLACIMEERNLRQTDIVRLCAPFAYQYNIILDRSDVFAYVSKGSVPSGIKLLVLAKALSVTPEWLLGYENENFNAFDGYLATLEYKPYLTKLIDVAANCSEEYLDAIINLLKVTNRTE